MNTEMRYGDVALGVESALPCITAPAFQRGRAQHLIDWLATALLRWT